MRRTIIVVGALVAGAMTLPAQSFMPKPEIRPFVGASIPTGTQRDFFEDAALMGLQGALEFKPTFHVLGTFSWVPSHNKYAFNVLWAVRTGGIVTVLALAAAVVIFLRRERRKAAAAAAGPAESPSGVG